MNWRSYLKMVLVALLPLAYTLIKAKNPGIPIGESEAVELIMWIVGAVIGGWEAMKLNIKFKIKQGAKLEELV